MFDVLSAFPKDFIQRASHPQLLHRPLFSPAQPRSNLSRFCIQRPPRKMHGHEPRPRGRPKMPRAIREVLLGRSRHRQPARDRAGVFHLHEHPTDRAACWFARKRSSEHHIQGDGACGLRTRSPGKIFRADCWDRWYASRIIEYDECWHDKTTVLFLSADQSKSKCAYIQ